MISYLYDPSIRSGMGGFQKVMELGRQLSRRHRVILFLPAYSRQETDLDCTWIPTVQLPMLRVLSFNLMLAPALILRALAGRPHLIYQRVFNSVSPPLLARLFGARYIVELNGNPLQFYRGRNSRAAPWVRRLVSWALRRADKIVALTEGLKQEARCDFAVPACKVHVAPSGSNPDLFFPRDRLECRKALELAPDGFLAVFAGTFFAYQGIDTLLDALADFPFRALQVWLLGDGVMRRAWERRAADRGITNIRFAGRVEHSRVPLFIGASDFCLAPFDPARGEVSPLKVMDYLFCARPTVIARIPSVECLLQRFPSLLPFTPGDPSSLAGRMGAVLQQPEHFSTLARRDAAAAARDYSWEQIARGIESNCFYAAPDSQSR